MPRQIPMIQGTVDVLILHALQDGPTHGYAVTRWIRERTGGTLALEDAALYQALHRLEARGWIDAEWGASENNRRARFYSLTAAGRRQLKAEAQTFRQYASAVFKIIDPS
jgi:PadR family transcriptional regulator, regulatory protein PadR